MVETKNINKHRFVEQKQIAVNRARGVSGGTSVEKSLAEQDVSKSEIPDTVSERIDASLKNNKKSDKPKTKKQNIGGHYVSDEKLIPITIRFTESAYNVIKDIAEMNGKSMADIVRLSVDDRLIQYLRNVVFINRAQGRDVQDRFFSLTYELEKIRYEINKIGVNYNQEVRLLHGQFKAGNRNLQPVFKRKAYDPVLIKLQNAADRIGRTAGRIMGMKTRE